MKIDGYVRIYNYQHSNRIVTPLESKALPATGRSFIIIYLPMSEDDDRFNQVLAKDDINQSPLLG